MTAREFWKGKRVAIIGLGPHGEMAEDAESMIKAGAWVSIYDLKSEARLKSQLIFLRSEGLANYVCGSIPADDLPDNDLIILSHEYPRDSSFLKAVLEKGVPVEYPETFFFKKAPPVTVIGVMGDSGKSTVVSMLSPMLESICKAEGQGFFVIDPESGEGIISKLKKAKNGDLVLMRITGEMMRELHSIRISPQVAVFTTVPGPGCYDSSPFEILEFQTYNNFIIASDEVIDATRRYKDLPRAKMLRTKASIIPPEWDLPNLSGGAQSHNRENAALVLQAARLFKVDDELAHRLLAKWKPLPGRLQAIKKVKGVGFYNDSASVNPNSTIRALELLSSEDPQKNVILVLGGADGSHDYRLLYPALADRVGTIVLLPGSGTAKERQRLHALEGIQVISAPSIEEAARLAMENAKKGDRVLFSPGFPAIGLAASRKERGERFVKAVRSL
ncbi:MAG: hypothetical protein KGI45_03535 [Patescibacteria group bacterium]|nr:hypothetical protein [Patescibacteria group bacterium]MDE1967115.1 hypothetical protein [Patescibacteria group bacterium]